VTRLQSTAILASAGSGKTFVLTSRFLALLLAGVAPERILAVTFTRAAAGEILSRLLKRLGEACESDAAASTLRAELAGADTIPVAMLNARSCREALRTLVDALDRLGVSTIDSFFARLAGTMALDLDLTPGWTIAEEAEDKALRSRAVESMVESLDPDETLRLVRLLHRGLYSPRVFKAVLDSVSSAYGVFRDAGARSWEEIGPITSPLSDDALRGARAAFALAPLGRTKAGQVHKSWQKAHDKAVAEITRDDWDAFLAETLVQAHDEVGGAYSGINIGPECRAAYQPIILHARAILLSRLRDQNLATREALNRFHESYTILRRRLGMLSFDDIPRALVDADAAGDLARVYYALDGTLDHALIDEFQDTSVTQFRLLEPLLDEIVSDPSGSRTVMCVGDVKQSLYQWRNAEPELLPWVPRHWTVINERPLDKSYRSAPQIIDTVNAVFTNLAQNPALVATEEGTLAARAWAERFNPHTTAKSFAGFASLTVTPAPGVEGAERSHIEHTAQHIASLARAFPNDTIGVLFPRRKRIARTLARLRALGVDAVVESGAGVADSPAVAAVLSLLTLADFPGNSAAAFHVATSLLSKVVGLAHPVPPARADEVAARIRRDLFEHGYAPTIARWADAVRDSCSPRDNERLARLVELGERFDSAAGTRSTEFVEFARAARLGEASTAPVRLLTVHGSKGLQFTRVVLPHLDDPIKPRAPGIVVERAGPLEQPTAVTRYAGEHIRRGHARLEAMHTHQTARAIGERLSVLYVALTRAEKRLDMLVEPKSAKEWPKTFAGLIHHALAGDTPRTAGELLWSLGVDDFTASPGPVNHPTVSIRSAQAVKAPPIMFGPPTGRATRTTAFSPSRAGEARPATVADALQSRSTSAAQQRGLLAHAWLEHIEWLDEPLSIGVFESTSKHLGLLWDDSAATLATSLAHNLNTGAAQNLLSRAGAASRFPADAALEVHRERPIAVRTILPGEREARLIVGRIDRLVVARSAGRVIAAEIIDFKTDGGSEPDEGLRDRYAPQLRTYRAAVATMLGVAPEHVKCALALVLQGRAVWID